MKSATSISSLSANSSATAEGNSLKSSGPRTPEGKLASSRNSTRHGLLTSKLLPDEDLDAYEALRDRLFDELAPSSGAEEVLVDDLVDLVWRLRRIARVEAALFGIGLPKEVEMALEQADAADALIGAAFAAQAHAFGVLSRYETTLANRLRRVLADLDRRRAEREASDRILVVSERGA